MRDCLIFMDTSAFLHSNYEAFMLRAAPLLKKYNVTIIVPSTVYAELNLVRSHPHMCREVAANAIKHIEAYTHEGVVSVQQYPGHAYCPSNTASVDFFAEQVAELCSKRKLLLITEDVQLAVDIVSPAYDGAGELAHPVRVVRIDAHGALQPVPVDIPESSSF